jgi:hypothetical protein
MVQHRLPQTEGIELMTVFSILVRRVRTPQAPATKDDQRVASVPGGDSANLNV